MGRETPPVASRAYKERGHATAASAIMIDCEMLRD